jgi:hypothetical protein
LPYDQAIIVAKLGFVGIWPRVSRKWHFSGPQRSVHSAPEALESRIRSFSDLTQVNGNNIRGMSVNDVDVVIVGAGSAGLAAAKNIAGPRGLPYRVSGGDGSGWRARLDVRRAFWGCRSTSAAPGFTPRTRNPYFAEAEAAGWTLHHHDMNVDHLYYGKNRASEEEEAAMKLADLQLSEVLDKWEGTDDRVSSLLATGHAPASGCDLCRSDGFRQGLRRDFRRGFPRRRRPGTRTTTRWKGSVLLFRALGSMSMSTCRRR